MWRNELYPLGFVGLMFTNTLFMQWVRYYYAPPEGVHTAGEGSVPGGARAVAALLLLGFLIQAAVNPVVGQWADRTRTRWGRRRPFVILGAAPLAGVFVGLFLGVLPGVLALLLYGALFVGVIQPYMSLLPSVARDEAMRLRLSLTGGVLSLLASGAALVLGPELIHRHGFVGLAWLGGGTVLALVVLPALLLREAPAPQAVPPFAGPGAFAAVVRESGILRFLVGNGLLTGSLAALTIVAPFVAKTLLEQPLDYTRQLNQSLFGGMVLSIPLLGLVVPRLGPLRSLRASAALGALVLLALWVAAGTAAGRAPGAHWQAAFGVFGLTALVAFSLPPVVIARYADADGRGREGLFFGSNGFALNVGNALAACSTSLLLELGAEGVRGVILLNAVALAVACALLGGQLPSAARPEGEPPVEA